MLKLETEGDDAPTRQTAYRPLPTEDWCPAHDCWYGAETECPGCREEWEQTWAIGEGPDGDEELEALNRYLDQRERDEPQDQWYKDLVNRANHPSDPHTGWRD